MKDATRNYIQAQINAFEQRTGGWIFWNFKTEASVSIPAVRYLHMTNPCAG